jgi:hypothetical protein
MALREAWALPAILACSVAACDAGTPRDSSPEPAQVDADTLELAIDAPPRIRRGRPVTLVLTARNVSGRVLDLYLRGREPTALVTVRDTAGDIVWRNITAGVPAILLLRTLEPGDTLTIADQWQPAVGPGTYTIDAELLGELSGIPYPPRTLIITR